MSQSIYAGSTYYQKAAKEPILFKALKRAEYGQLSVITPEGERLDFIGTMDGPNAHWIIEDWGVLTESVARGEIGFAETYMQKRWHSNDLPQLITFFLLNSHVLERFFHGRPLHSLGLLISNWFARNSLSGSRKNIQRHYDLGNEFYALWLDRSMTYSSALFEGDSSRSLEEAQQAKYQRILKKLGAVPGDHILEIGCGWGGFAEAAAKQGLRVTSITISREQADYARQRLHNQRLDKLAQIELVDYREMKGQFDYIVSIGMFEHVGKRYWKSYFDTIQRLLVPGGKAMIQSITLDDALFEKLGNTTGFIEKYIFPGGFLPSKRRFKEAAQKAGLHVQEVFAFGGDYARTLSHWLNRFEAHIGQVRAMGYDTQFIRMWRFYLASCIATFVSKRSDVMQVEITKI